MLRRERPRVVPVRRGASAVEQARGDDHRIFEPRRFAARRQPLTIGFRVLEAQGIGRGEPCVVFVPFLVVQQASQPLERRHPEMVRTLAADMEVVRQLLGIEHLAALRALDPDALGHAARAVGGRGDGLPDLLEPRHSE